MDARFRMPVSPVAHPEAVVQGDRWRFSVLTDGLVRIEWAPDGVFEDRASTFALHRDLPVPRFEVVESDAVVEILTDRLHLTYDRGPFTPAGPLGAGPRRPHLVAQPLALRRRRPRPRRHGPHARHGRRPHPPRARRDRPRRRHRPRRLDVVPLHGRRLGRAPPDRATSTSTSSPTATTTQGALRAFYDLSGPQPVLPRWTLGNWWSRYHRYSADEYRELLDRFERERIRFSVAVLDMDWHRVESVPPEFGSGWTGYSWERELFPDPAGFLAELHDRGLRVTLNVHPADGVRAFEDAYPDMARALGRDPERGLPIAFDITDPAFLEAYFDVLHHRLEDEGVDFWWIDWQQGPYSRIPGIDPLWMLNHYHFLDSGRGDRRPLTFSRYAGPGSHRYPVGFSGDTIISWASLDFQPEFTATASNIGYGWWSHDVGGHLWGVRDDELTARWVQLGVWSPILRLHSSNNPFLAKEPWMFPEETRAAIDEALRFRVRLVPYLHSMNHRGGDRRACRSSGRCTTSRRMSRPPTRCRTSSRSAASWWSRPSRRRATR